MASFQIINPKVGAKKRKIIQNTAQNPLSCSYIERLFFHVIKADVRVKSLMGNVNRKPSYVLVSYY